MKTQCIT